MAMFGFVYIWYLMAVLLLEIWFDHRKELILRAEKEKGLKRLFFKILSLYSKDISPHALAFDKKAVYAITVIGIPSAFLLHGYVGFIFGSVKANPWWSSVLMPIVFLFSAIVSGIALMLLLYMITTLFSHRKLDMVCLDKLAGFLFYMMLVDFSLEGLDFVQRVYQSEESIKILAEMISQRLFISLIVIQLLLGMLLPLAALSAVRIFRFSRELRKLIYFVTAVLVQFGIFATRWNVVIGGQLFSKSFRGLTVYKIGIGGMEGLLVSFAFLILPFVILYVLAKILPPWEENPAHQKIIDLSHH